MLDPTRTVGTETTKSYARKIADGFFDRYLAGDAILEIGFRGYFGGSEPIVEQAIGIDVDYPGYDGTHLPFPDNSQDAIYTSHTLEHISDYQASIREWFRVLKLGGHLVIVVPHQFLYEKKTTLPPRWNFDHKRFYTPASLLQEIETTLEPNTYRVRHLADNDAGYDYTKLPHEESVGCFEIELVLQKIHPPVWLLNSGIYPAAEFRGPLPRVNPMQLQTDFSITDQHVIFGPYIYLPVGSFEACFHFRTEGLGEDGLASDILLDVASDAETLASVRLSGINGAELLRTEMIRLRFENRSNKSLFEFRTLTEGHPFDGILTFTGVSLKRLG